ncbi:MAG TPA: ATP-dependent DNA helicase [Marinobacter sp.]|nr:ATP-dependent DNA helicase [Marinobacter sp.]
MKIAVRTLCEFAARVGDLDFRYTPAPTAAEGTAGHQLVQSRRGPDFDSEYLLTGECMGLKLTGRADGFSRAKKRLEEIKTHRGDLSRVRPPQRALHRAQLRAYGALLCRQEGLRKVELALIYYDIGRDRETALAETASAQELWQELETLCTRYQVWAQQEEHHRAQRDHLLAGLRFPFDHFRPRQRQLAETVYKSAVRGTTLLLEAPTGLGKTMGTLFPALMALPVAAQDRLFYLTCRNTARQLALDAVLRLQDARGESEPWPLRVLELVAKDDACEHPDKACHGASCPLAKGFFDRLPDARAEAAQCREPLSQQRLAEIAEGHAICPYFLAQEMARWSDLIIGDVNRLFDQSALLHGLTVQNSWRTSVLVDEAHNLVDRARGMYSVELDQQRLLRVRKTAPKALKAALDRVARAWQRLVREFGEQPQPVFMEALPPQLPGALQALVSVITDYLADQPPDLALQELLFESVAFLKLADSFGSHSLCVFERAGRGRASVALQNLIPSDFLTGRFAAAHSVVLFSATLTPGVYYRDLLGLTEAVRFASLPSPFSASQLQVNFTPGISTRQAHRQASLQPIAGLIARQYQERPGHYLAFFSSFKYAREASDTLARTAPEIPQRAQQPGMSPDQRQAFLAGFREPQGCVAFAVLGGVFSEGIDLPGDQLIGAFVATLGLPPFDPWHEVLKDRLQQRFGDGYNYTYLIPGLQKVAQAAGRVIRTPDDRGVIWLIDDRFLQPGVNRMLPGWWFARPVCSSG